MRIHGPDALSNTIGSAVSPSDRPFTDRRGVACAAPPGGDFRDRFPRAAIATVHACGLVVVSGHGRTGDRNCPSWITGEGRPVHLLAADWLVFDHDLGRLGRLCQTALSSPDSWRSFGVGHRRFDGLCTEPNHLLAR